MALLSFQDSSEIIVFCYNIATQKEIGAVNKGYSVT